MRPATFLHTLRSEWQKLSSLRSFWWALVGTVVAGVGIGALISSDAAQTYRSSTAESRSTFDPVHESLFTGLIFAMLATVVLGVIVMTSEYASGMIRSSLAAVPNRRRLLMAKATVLAAVSLAVGVPVGFGMFLTGQAVFAAHGVPQASLDQPDVLRAVLGVGLVMTATALLGLGVGTIVRGTAAGIAIMFTATLLVPTAILPSLPPSIGQPLLMFWPSAAGMQILSTRGVAGALPPLGGLTWLWAVTVLVLVVAFTVFRTRDV
ncbi:ABC transporter permease [Pseudonocardia sp. TRM90224]|uniref:ABC transporter permease n=1 Tax=Pseudonocardia sp. TRM90224 TaxID=2812678 RepID=UPI0027E0FC94|nr:ABC transporter permease [Pseudonocardia sp. TRM90224]